MRYVSKELDRNGETVIAAIPVRLDTLVAHHLSLESAVFIRGVNGTVVLKTRDTSDRVATAREVGDRMDDGTIYAGISPHTGKPLYVLPADAPLTMKWKAAMEYADSFEGHGHPKGAFRIPTQSELNVLFEYHASIGGFNEAGRDPARYWSSTEYLDYTAFVWEQSFLDGSCYLSPKSYELHVRLVRS